MVRDKITIHKKAEPVLLDKVIQDIQDSLNERLPWLDIVFGKAHKLVDHRLEGDKFIYPAAYIGNSEYVSLLPNDNFGNFAWFDIYDPQDVISTIQSNPQFTFSGAIVFWYKATSIYQDDNTMYTEEIKNEIINALTTPGLIKQTGRLEIKRIYERFENIYKGYSLEKIYNNFSYKGDDIQSIDKQFFMHPYSGIRIEFEITTRELCQRFIKR